MEELTNRNCSYADDACFVLHKEYVYLLFFTRNRHKSQVIKISEIKYHIILLIIMAITRVTKIFVYMRWTRCKAYLYSKEGDF